MANQILTGWKPGMDLPYTVPLGENGMLAILLRAAWVKADQTGQPLLLPPAVRALDRLRAIFASDEQMTPGFIVSLRKALGLTQEELGRKLGVSKMTVSRWECARMRPSASAATAIRALRGRAQRQGVRIDGGLLSPARRTA